MNIFINDRLVKIITDKYATELAYSEYYDKVLDIRLNPLKPEKITGHVLLLNADVKTIERLFSFLNKSHYHEFNSITIAVKDKEKTEELVESFYTIIKAAGGVVEKNDSILLIHRLGKWDLPKGKLEKNEKSKTAAIREVFEETGLVVNKNSKVEIFDIDIHTIPERKSVPEHLHYDVRFLFIVHENEKFQISDESTDIKWVSFAEIENYNIDGSVWRMVRKVIE